MDVQQALTEGYAGDIEADDWADEGRELDLDMDLEEDYR